MDLLDRLLGHDAWTTGELLGRCADLTNAQLDRPFDIGHRTIRATLHHVIANMEVWTRLMDGHPDPTAGIRQADRTMPGLSARLEAAAADFARLARQVATRHAWDDRWLDVLDDPPAEKTFGGAIAHVLTHDVHHRAQLLYMLRRIGVPDLPEGDVLSWERRAGDA